MAPTVNVGDSVMYVVGADGKSAKATVKDIPAYLDRSDDHGALVRNDGSVVSLIVFPDAADLPDQNFTANRSEPRYVPYSRDKSLGTWHLPSKSEE